MTAEDLLRLHRAFEAEVREGGLHHRCEQRDQRIKSLEQLLDAEISAKASLKSQIETQEKSMVLEVKLAQARAEAKMQGKAGKK